MTMNTPGFSYSNNDSKKFKNRNKSADIIGSVSAENES